MVSARTAVVAVAALLLAAPARLPAQPGGAALAAAGITERVGRPVPLPLAFTDAHGRRVRLGDLVGHGRPVLLSLGYYHCATLCPVLYTNTAAVLRDMHAAPGRDVLFVSVSIDPGEDTTEAAMMRAKVATSATRALPDDAWRVLTGDSLAIAALADAVGVRFAYDAATGQYAHPSAWITVDETGAIASYINGVTPTAAELDQAVQRAHAGVQGSWLHRAVVRCFRFVPALREQAGLVTGVLRGGGASVLLAMLLFAWWLRRRGAARRAEEG